MKALVLGYGRSGKAAEALLKDLGYEVVVCDESCGDPQRGGGILASAEQKEYTCSLCGGRNASAPGDAATCGGRNASAPRGTLASVSPEGGTREKEPGREAPASAFSFAVVSPGIPLTHPWIAACRECGILLKSELQLGCEELKRRGWKLLAVTGSKGKSSVVKIVADAINLAGGHGVACGNYGVPVCEVALQKPSTFNLQPSTSPWAIVEVSSFMMETTELPADTFEAATILNLQEDHLDRHGSVETYHALKRKLLTMAKVAVGDSLRAAEPPRPLQLFSGSYFDNPILRENGACAVGLMRAAGLDDSAIAEAFRTFEPLPHRMNVVAEINGVRYIDDSKATSLAALVAGVSMAGSPLSVRLIAGGLPKGDDPKSALPILTERVRKVYLIGQSAELFRSAWSSSVDCEVCGTMNRAVEAARRDAVKGETVLLSPGTASFDQFKSFGERGDVFTALVKKGKTE